MGWRLHPPLTVGEGRGDGLSMEAGGVVEECDEVSRQLGRPSCRIALWGSPLLATFLQTFDICPVPFIGFAKLAYFGNHTIFFALEFTAHSSFLFAELFAMHHQDFILSGRDD